MNKKFLLIGITVFLAVSLSAAGRNDTNASSQTMKFYAFEGGYGRAYFDDMAAQFQAAHPGTTVELTADPEIGTILRADIAAGQWPDFVFGANPQVNADEYIKNRELLDITDVMDSEVPGRPGTKIRDYVIDGILSAPSFSPYGDGRIYRAPFQTAPLAVIYNQNLFENKGWKLPETWDEFFALAAELEKPENYVTIDGQRIKRSLFTYQGLYPYYLAYMFWPAIASAVGPAGIDKILSYTPGAFSGPEVRQIVENFAKIGSGSYLMEGTAGLNHTQSQADMMLGKALFIPCGDWIENEMVDAPREPGFSFGMAASPILRTGQDRYAYSGTGGYFIPAAARNPTLAKEFLRFLYSDASVISFAKNPSGVIAVKNAVELGKPYLSEGIYGMFQIYNSAKALFMDFEQLPPNSRVTVDWWPNLGLLVNGNMTVDEYIAFLESICTQVTEDKANAR